MDTLDMPPEHPPTGEIFHTVPSYDWKEHVTDGGECPCGPVEDTYENGNIQVIHNAFDGREHLEKDHEYKDCVVCQADIEQFRKELNAKD